MSAVKNYQIILKSDGGITQLPDSQKVFGTLVTMFAQRHGSEKATELVQSVFRKEIHLALSNVMPKNYVPVPTDYLTELLPAEKVKINAEKQREECREQRWKEKVKSETGKQSNRKEANGQRKENEDGKSRKMMRSDIKERAFVKLEDLKKMQEHPDKCDQIYPYIKQYDSQQLRASLESVIYSMEGLETKLYTVPVLNLYEIESAQDSKMNPVTQFCFYLQMNESEPGKKVLEFIDSLAHTETSLIMGKRASQGLNKYRVAGVKEVHLPDSDTYLNMGMLLPDKIDFSASTLKLFTSERRPFFMPGGWETKARGYFISFIDAGSMIKLPGGIEQAGKSVPSPFYKTRDIVFGNAFLYPIVWGRGAGK